MARAEHQARIADRPSPDVIRSGRRMVHVCVHALRHVADLFPASGWIVGVILDDRAEIAAELRGALGIAVRRDGEHEVDVEGAPVHRIRARHFRHASSGHARNRLHLRLIAVVDADPADLADRPHRHQRRVALPLHVDGRDIQLVEQIAVLRAVLRNDLHGGHIAVIVVGGNGKRLRRAGNEAVGGELLVCQHHAASAVFENEAEVEQVFGAAVPVLQGRLRIACDMNRHRVEVSFLAESKLLRRLPEGHGIPELRPVHLSGAHHVNAAASAAAQILCPARTHVRQLLRALLYQDGICRGIRKPVHHRALHRAVKGKAAGHAVRGNSLPVDGALAKGVHGRNRQILHLPIVMTAGRAHPHLDVRDLLDILKRHKKAQRLSLGDALIVGDILLRAAVPPAVEVTGQFAHIQCVGHLGVALQIRPVDAHHDVVLRPRAGDRIGRQLKEITLRPVARREELAALIRRQAEPVLAHAKGAAAHIRYRLIISGAAAVGVFDGAGAVVHLRGDLDGVVSGFGQVIDRHGNKAGIVALAEPDPVRPLRSGGAARRCCHAQRIFCLLRAKRDGDPLVRDKRNIVRQEDAQRHSLALLSKAGNRLFQVIGREQPLGKLRRVQHSRHLRRVLLPIAVDVVKRHRHGLRKAHIGQRTLGHRPQRLQAGAVGIGEIEAQRQRLFRVVLPFMMRVGRTEAGGFERDVHAVISVLGIDQFVGRPCDVQILAHRAFGDQVAFKVDVAVVRRGIPAVQSAQLIHAKDAHGTAVPAAAVGSEKLHARDLFDRLPRGKQVLIR